MIVLGIETSCDDTSVAIVNSKGSVLAMAVASQDEVHMPFGGVVPEIAGRNHSENLIPLIDTVLQKAQMEWDKIDGIAVTNRPGLVGSLIVGLVTAKTLALVKNKKLIGVHHIEGHLMAPFLSDQDYVGPGFYQQPFAALIVSGGHTQLYKVESFGNYKLIGQTVDDAAGEAFDKFAKKIGLGYPGGPLVDKISANGNPVAFKFPEPMSKSNDFNMSFSGLKTFANNLISKMNEAEIENNKADLCASYQMAIVNSLITKTENAMVNHGLKKLVISGGVSANTALRKKAEELCQKLNFDLAIPPLRYCTDNAAMIAFTGLKKFENGESSDQSLSLSPSSELQNL